MTIRKDYLLRLMDEFFKFLAKILQLKSEKNYQQALALIDEASQALLHLDLNELAQNEEKFSMLTTGGKLSHEQIEVLAQLLKAKADISLETYNNFTAINLYEKSLFLLEHLQVVSKDYSLPRINLMREVNYHLMNLKG
jgi:hypothetical protein